MYLNASFADNLKNTVVSHYILSHLNVLKEPSIDEEKFASVASQKIIWVRPFIKTVWAASGCIIKLSLSLVLTDENTCRFLIMTCGGFLERLENAPNWREKERLFLLLSCQMGLHIRNPL